MNFSSLVTVGSALALSSVLASGCGQAVAPDTDTGPTTSDGGTMVDSGVDAASTNDSGNDAGHPSFDAGHRVPAEHRADDSQCAGAAPAGNCSFGGGSAMCDMDSDCTTGTNGRCNMSIGGAPFCECNYDACAHDTDCPTGSACACHGAYRHRAGNECIAGNCRVDGDCGVNGYCSPTIGGCGGLTGYYCHTANDTCVDDSDCTASHGCQYVSAQSRWQCVELSLCE